MCMEYTTYLTIELTNLDTWKEVTMAKQLKFIKDNFRDLTFGSNFLTQQKYHKENLVWLLFM